VSSPQPTSSSESESDEGLALEPRHRLSVAKKLLFALLVLLGALGGVEVVCRVLWPLEPVAPHISDWQQTPEGRTFWVLRNPGYNQDGLRDRTHAQVKPPGVHRIVCLGDSVTLGHGLKMHETYPRLLESFLQQMGLKVEVFNVAISGWSTLQEVAAYRALARPYQPDQVFLAFCLNDVAEMHNNLSQPPSAGLAWLVRHSALVSALVDAEGQQVKHVTELFRIPETPAVDSGWQRVFAELTALQQETARDGCALSVLIFPFRFQMKDGAPKPVAQETLFTYCYELGIPCLDLLPALRSVGPEAFLDENHLSVRGAQVVATEIVRWGRSGCMMCGSDLSGVSTELCPRCGHPVGR